MTAPADLVLTNAVVYPLAGEPAGPTDPGEGRPDETAAAVAVRDGRVVRVGRAAEVEFLAGVETDVRDCGGRVVLPGFVDAHTHLSMVGRRLVNADLGAASSPADAVDLLAAHAAEPTDPETVERADEWVVGFGYDESTWAESRYLTRADLDRASTERPVVAVREDMHLASLNSAALEALRGEMPDDDVDTEGGEPTGVVVEDALSAVWTAVEPGRERAAALVRAAQRRANEVGVTAVHDMVRDSPAPRVYRDLAAAGELTVRVRIHYWADHLDALAELGLATNHGDGLVRTGAVKTFTDGSIGGHTARLSEAYADLAGDGDLNSDPAGDGASDGDPDGDANGDNAGDSHGGADADADDARGQWVVDPERFGEIVARADADDRQMAAHAIGDEAIRAVLDAYAAAGDRRHRVEHAEVLTDDLVRRLGAEGVVVSAQPNFLKWAREGGLYATRLGEQRRRASNRFRALVAAGATLAFGSDCMPLDPLYGIEQTVTAPTAAQRLSVTAALRAYTSGAAYAGFDEDRLGSVEAGKRADLVVLDESPWAVDPDEIGDIDVATTVVDGRVVFDADGQRD
jgi:predicted amidohydrolase YtcJ